MADWALSRGPNWWRGHSTLEVVYLRVGAQLHRLQPPAVCGPASLIAMRCVDCVIDGYMTRSYTLTSRNDPFRPSHGQGLPLSPKQSQITDSCKLSFLTQSLILWDSINWRTVKGWQIAKCVQFFWFKFFSAYLGTYIGFFILFLSSQFSSDKVKVFYGFWKSMTHREEWTLQ